jgi:hypothetical protein
VLGHGIEELLGILPSCSMAKCKIIPSYEGMWLRPLASDTAEGRVLQDLRSMVHGCGPRSP